MHVLRYVFCMNTRIAVICGKSDIRPESSKKIVKGTGVALIPITTVKLDSRTVPGLGLGGLGLKYGSIFRIWNRSKRKSLNISGVTSHIKIPNSSESLCLYSSAIFNSSDILNKKYLYISATSDNFVHFMILPWINGFLPVSEGV